MSEAMAHAFLDAVEMDSNLQQRVAALRGKDAITSLCALAGEAGYVFTEADYRGAVVARSAGELSDESLDELIQEMADGSDA